MHREPADGRLGHLVVCIDCALLFDAVDAAVPDEAAFAAVAAVAA